MSRNFSRKHFRNYPKNLKLKWIMLLTILLSMKNLKLTIVLKMKDYLFLN